jgi:hypothetical protein
LSAYPSYRFGRKWKSPVRREKRGKKRFQVQRFKVEKDRFRVQRFKVKRRTSNIERLTLNVERNPSGALF